MNNIWSCLLTMFIVWICVDGVVGVLVFMLIEELTNIYDLMKFNKLLYYSKLGKWRTHYKSANRPANWTNTEHQMNSCMLKRWIDRKHHPWPKWTSKWNWVCWNTIDMDEHKDTIELQQWTKTWGCIWTDVDINTVHFDVFSHFISKEQAIKQLEDCFNCNALISFRPESNQNIKL